MKYALPHMVKKGGGSIINTASIAGMVAIRRDRLLRGKGRRDRVDPRRCARIWPLQYPRQLHLPHD